MIRPVLSVIVCTYNRPDGLYQALQSIWQQREADLEVIVVDDGGEVPVRLPDAPHGALRLLRIEHRGVGAARAIGLAAAHGMFIAYCDDDDVWTPDHLATLLPSLQAHPEVALVYGDAAWDIVDGGEGVCYHGPWLGAANQIRATDTLHRADVARRAGGFDPSLRAYEDLDLWARMEREQYILHHLPGVVARHTLHAGRVMAHDHPTERERLSRYYSIGYVPPERKPAPPPPHFDPTTWQPGRRELLWETPLNNRQSFGLVGRQLLLAAERAGIAPMIAVGNRGAFPELARFCTPRDGIGRIGFSYEYGVPFNPLPAALAIVHTMRESTFVPRARVADINRRAALLYVPSRQNLESFYANGVRVPIKILHYGVDPARFPMLERRRAGDEPFTFGAFGHLSPRKGIDVLIRAFHDEFAPHEPVRLLLKSWQPVELHIDDPRITFNLSFLEQDGLLHYLSQLDTFVLPSRGEGFGLGGLEAMATGLPVIATNWSGPVEYLDPADSFPLEYRLVDAAGIESNFTRYFGQWAEPDYEHLRTLLRWIYEHPSVAMNRGQQAAARVLRDWTWDRIACQLRDDCDLLARGISPV
jgi:glycosyltransferase involved in cell wall biosynthesis